MKDDAILRSINRGRRGPRRRRNRGFDFPVKYVLGAVAVVVAIVLIVLLTPGRIKETDAGITYRRFGVAAKDKWITKKKNTYHFNKKGYADVGWSDVDGATYYFDEKGVMQKGWLEMDGLRYHLDEKDGKLSKGFCSVDETPYYFDEVSGGALRTEGIIRRDDRVIAVSEPDGRLQTGLLDVEGTMMFFSETGESRQGWFDKDGATYYCNADGTIAKGNVDVEGKRYYFDGNGVRQMGWCQDEAGNMMYAGEDGSLAVGKCGVEGRLYYFNGEGIMQKGWINVSETERCYAGEDGVLCTGVQNISGIEFNFDENGNLISQNDSEVKMVALTFDDGPSNNTDKILDVLQEFDCKATFFVVGSRISQYSGQLKRLSDMGCEVGSHTFNHKYLTSLSPEDMQTEMNRTDEAVESVTGQRTKSIRPPGGFYNDDVCSRINVPIIMWSVDTQDWKTRDPQSIAHIATSGIKDGDIILMHDLYSTTAEAVRAIVPSLLSQGFRIVTISELLDAHGGSFGGKVYSSAVQ